MRHKLGEAEIYTALEGACAKVWMRVPAACRAAMPPAKDMAFSASGAVCGRQGPAGSSMQEVQMLQHFCIDLSLQHLQQSSCSAAHIQALPLLLTSILLACSALEPLKDRVEEYIFQNGVEQLRRHLCIEMLGACSMHMLYDSGEL